MFGVGYMAIRLLAASVKGKVGMVNGEAAA